MPGVPDAEAFIRLEQALDRADAMKAHKSLPRPFNPQPKTHVMSAFYARSDTTDDDTTSEATMNRSSTRGTSSPSFSSRQLPPTPPSTSRGAVGQALQYSVAASAEHAGKKLHSQKSRTSTPVNSKGLPTPETTPPSTREKYLMQRPELQHYASSAADSFATAKEEQSISSRHASQQQLQLEHAALWAPLPTSPLRNVADSEEDASGDGGETTPKETRRILDKEFPWLAQQQNEHVWSYEGGEEGTLSRSATVRRVRSAITEPVVPVAESVPLHSTTGPSSAGEQGESMQDHVHEPDNHMDNHLLELGSNETEWPSGVNNIVYAHIRDEKAKRLSTMSESSTMVEAVVLIRPPDKQRVLRRAGRNLALRDNAVWLPINAPTSLESEDFISHRLKHRRSPIPDRNRKPSIESCDSVDTDFVRGSRNMAKSSPSSTHLAVPSTPGNRRGSSRVDSTISEELSPKLRHKNTRIGRERDGGRPYSLTHESLEALNASHGVIDTPLGLGITSRPDWYRSQEDVYLLSDDTDIHHSQGQKSRQHSGATDLLDPSPNLSHLSEFPTPPKHHEARQFLSFDSLAPFSPRKTSVAHRMDMTHARRRDASHTPISGSQLSDRTDTLEINEARAMSIHTHANKSWTVVQQAARPAYSSRTLSDEAIDVAPVSNTSAHPVFTAVVEPSTPKAKRLSLYPSSSSQSTPHILPQPPLINFIPPTPAVTTPAATTPAEEAERQLAPPHGPERSKSVRFSTDVPSSRRMSLVEKARRYSENLVQPILARTTSMGRRHGGRSSEAEPGRAANLHPFWRPRGFWDDFNSDSELDSENDDFATPLPPGGDTSDVMPSTSIWYPRKLSVRMPGFRGTGGFLLGNTLGLNRHGTNKRRHYVDPPAAHTLRKRKSEDMLRVALSASTESLRQRYGKRQRVRGLPRLVSFEVGGLGLRDLKDRMRLMRRERDEKVREERRARLRGKFGKRV